MFAALNAFLTRAVSGYFLNKSLRFRSSASAYLNRTFAAGNQSTWTWSAWVKRGVLGTYPQMFSAGAGTGGSPELTILFEADALRIDSYNGSTTVFDVKSTALYRDPAAWYHVVVAFDTTQATAADRVKFYINGQQITSFATASYPGQNTTHQINAATSHQISGSTRVAAYYYDGEMAEINFVGGYPTGVTSGTWAATNVSTIFGAYSIYNQWLPIAYAGTYGTNGFYLPFTNTTSTSTLVADSSGNGNNWTPNNISLTAGSTYDSLTDVPTLTSTTVANYAVLNPLSIRSGAPKSSDGNLTIAWGGTYPANALATIGVSTGKWYWEVGFAGGTFSNNPQVGVAVTGWSNLNADPATTASPFSHIVGGNSSFWNNGTATANSVSYGPGDTVGVALNCDTNVVSFYKNNTLIGTAQSIESGQTWFPIHANSSYTALTQYANYGQQPFTYTAPSGFLPLNTFNI